MSQRLPSLNELLVAQQEYATSNMYTAIPGVVVTVHRGLQTMTVDVKPAINMRSEDGSSVSERPPILNVPLHMPLTKEGGLSYPISVGTPVFLMFSMRGLEVWKRSNGYPATPSDVRKFDVRDCIALPGVYPMGEAPNNPAKHSLAHSTDDVVLVHNLGTDAECEVRLKRNGDVIVNSPGKVEVNCTSASVNASASMEINTGAMTINSSSFVVATGTYAISATESATMQANLSQTGSFQLNGIALESHKHPENDGGGPTDGPIN